MTLDQWADMVAREALTAAHLSHDSPLHDAIVTTIRSHWDYRPNDNQNIIDKAMHAFNEQRNAALKRTADEQV